MGTRDGPDPLKLQKRMAWSLQHREKQHPTPLENLENATLKSCRNLGLEKAQLATGAVRGQALLHISNGARSIDGARLLALEVTCADLCALVGERVFGWGKGPWLGVGRPSYTD